MKRNVLKGYKFNKNQTSINIKMLAYIPNNVE